MIGEKGQIVDEWKMFARGPNPEIKTRHTDRMHLAGLEARTLLYQGSKDMPEEREVRLRVSYSEVRRILSQIGHQMNNSIPTPKYHGVYAELREGVYVPVSRLKREMPSYIKLSETTKITGVIYDEGLIGANVREQIIDLGHYINLGRPETITLTTTKTIRPDVGRKR